MSTTAPTKRTLVIEVDVTGFTDEQIATLDMHMAVQCEAFDADDPDEGISYPDAEPTVSRIVDRCGEKRPRVTWLSGEPPAAVSREK